MLSLAKFVVHIAALLPLIWIYYGAIHDTIGADPVERVIHFTGIGALNILLLCLSISPLAKFLKKPVLMKFRRLMGLWAFTYASLHIVNFWLFELQLDWRLFVSEVIERPYITVGVFAFTILLMLAVTSLNTLKRQMGKSWQALHNWVYVAAIAIWVHFYWSVKSDVYEPGLYAVCLLVLLAMRRVKIRRWLKLP